MPVPALSRWEGGGRGLGAPWVGVGGPQSSRANVGAWIRWGRGGAANEFQEVSCEGPRDRKAFTGVSGGGARTWPSCLFWTSLLSL